MTTAENCPRQSGGLKRRFQPHDSAANNYTQAPMMTLGIREADTLKEVSLTNENEMALIKSLRHICATLPL
jgi:hypothetical protein